jgi:hypothetical protein
VLVRGEAVGGRLFQVCLHIIIISSSLLIPRTQAAKTADLILIMLDATKSDEHKRQLEYELDAVGIRLNKSKPDVVFKKKTTGGVKSIANHTDILCLTYFRSL